MTPALRCGIVHRRNCTSAVPVIASLAKQSLLLEIASVAALPRNDSFAGLLLSHSLVPKSSSLGVQQGHIRGLRRFEKSIILASKRSSQWGR